MGPAAGRPLGQPPVERPARPPERALHVGVKQNGAAGEGVHFRHRFRTFDPQAPNHAQAPPDEPAALLGRLVAVQLRRVQADDARDLRHALRRFVHENADPRTEGGQRLAHLSRLSYLQATGRAGNKIQSQGVGTGAQRPFGILHRGQSANLHPDHGAKPSQTKEHL